MSDLVLPISEELCTHLAQLLDAHRPELVSRYQQVLREALFSRRTTIRPSMLGRMASEEVDAFGEFLYQRHAIEHGVQFHQTGLSGQPLLRLGQVTRQFFLTYLESDQIAPALAVIDAYQEEVILGFMQSLEKAVFNEQERTRHAFERVVNRDKL